MYVLDKLEGVLAKHFDAERRWADFPDIEALLKCLGLRALVLIPRDSNKSHWMQCRERARVDIVGFEQSIPDVFFAHWDEAAYKHYDIGESLAPFRAAADGCAAAFV